MFLEILPALFHFHEHDGFPDIIGEGRAAAVLVGFADAEFGRAARVETTGLAEGLKKAVEEEKARLVSYEAEKKALLDFIADLKK